MAQKPKIVGIGGLPRSGKDTLAEMFMRSGYFGVSFGDIVRGFARERHKDKPDPISVVNMTETSNWLRESQGADVILREALHQFEKKLAAGEEYEGIVLYSIRAPAEVDFILAKGGELIWVETDDKIRFKRAAQHRREGETDISLEEFQRQEALQARPQPGTPAEAQMNTDYVKSKATRQLLNNGDDIAAFHAAAQDLLKSVTFQK